MKTFIIADNQFITNAGMQFLLTMQKDPSVIIDVINKEELIQKLRLYTDAIVILDYSLFNFISAEELIITQQRFKQTCWILFSEELSISLLRQLLFSSNSFSVVMKNSPKEEIQSAIQYAVRQERFICNYVSNLLLANTQQQSGISTYSKEESSLLTTTEKAILKEIASGKTTKEIATQKNISFHTVNSHRKNIFRKIGVNNVHEATKYAMRAGIIDLAEYYI